MKHLTVTIHGRVQGVGFRYAAQREAQKLNLVGFARNEPNGSVHIEAEGEEAALGKFLAWCHKGPWFAKITHVDEEWSDKTEDFREFSVR